MKYKIFKFCCCKNFLFIVLITSQLFFSSACNKDVNHQANKPIIPPPDSATGLNVILILGDDIGYEMLTCNGGQSYSTPNLDKMAAQGMRFTQCHSSPLCSPSRFMFLTGKYNFRNYIKWGIMSPSEKTIANIFKDAGYATCVAGKWQLDGGDASIKNFGFEKYLVYEPFTGMSEKAHRYKNPVVYEAGNYLPDSMVVNKYGEDLFTNYVDSFMDSAAKSKKPFFIYYPMVLCHSPFCPTPDDPEFKNWNSDNKSEPAFFPSMAKYMDKKVGQVIAKVKALGIEKNTVIIYVGDNGTPGEITSKWYGILIPGGKNTTTEYGTHVPFIAYCPGSVPSGAVNDDLVSFPDFLLTVTNVAGLKVPEYFGTTDGISFYSGLSGGAGDARDWIFCHFDPENGSGEFSRWVQNRKYKLYDSNGNFFNIEKDVQEENPIPLSLLTPEELTYDASFQRILDSLK